MALDRTLLDAAILARFRGRRRFGSCFSLSLVGLDLLALDEVK